MSTCRHKNVISYFVSFVDDTDLWLVMPYLAAGSVADVISSKFPEGVKDEVLVATILREATLSLEYFHSMS